MADQQASAATVSVDTTATLIATIPANTVAVITGTEAFVIGGSGVTASDGFPVAATTVTTLPKNGSRPADLYGIVASTTSDVSVLFFPA